MNSNWEDWVGIAVKVWTGRGGVYALRGMYFGILEGFDEYALFVRQPDGETVFLPLETVTKVEPFDPDESKPEGNLLRASTEPVKSRLLRPARGTQPENRNLLRPTEPEIEG